MGVEAMRVTYAFVCDDAHFTPDSQRLDVTGIHLTPIVFDAFPYEYANLSYVCAVYIPQGECRADHTQRLYCLAPDGTAIGTETTYTIDASKGARNPRGYRHVAIGDFLGFTFATDGTYTFHAEFDGQEVDETPMRTILLPESLP